MTVYGSANYNGVTFTLYGRPGSTILDEVNRLANGGEYPSYQQYLDIQGAMNTWTGAPTGTAINASLNYKIDPNRQPVNFQESMDAVNTIASTKTGKQNENLEVVTALRTIRK